MFALASTPPLFSGFKVASMEGGSTYELSGRVTYTKNQLPTEMGADGMIENIGWAFLSFMIVAFVVGALFGWMLL